MFVFPNACDFQQKVNFLEIKDQLCRRVVLDERARKLFDKVAEATSNSNRRRHSPAEKLKSFDNQTTQNNNNTKQHKHKATTTQNNNNTKQQQHKPQKQQQIVRELWLLESSIPSGRNLGMRLPAVVDENFQLCENVN